MSFIWEHKWSTEGKKAQVGMFNIFATKRTSGQLVSTQARQELFTPQVLGWESNTKGTAQSLWLGRSLGQKLRPTLTLPSDSEELYLLKVVRQKHKVDAAESQLSDDEEEIHDAPAERERQGQNPSVLEASLEMNISAAVLTFPSQWVTRTSCDKKARCAMLPVQSLGSICALHVPSLVLASRHELRASPEYNLAHAFYCPPTKLNSSLLKLQRACGMKV